MLVGIIIGAVMVTVFSIVEGLSKKKLEAELTRRSQIIQQQATANKELHEKLKKAVGDLLYVAKCGEDLANDYHIVVSLLSEEIGFEETEKRFKLVKESNKPKSMNELLNEILKTQQAKKED